MQYKDDVLATIAERGGNIGQFTSYTPNGRQRYARIRGIDPAHRFKTIEAAIRAILDTGAPFVNIRSFLPKKSDGNPFIMGRNGFETPEKLGAKARELIAQGFYLILNEELDVNDGGFSGVLMGNVAEFATRDVPRCVEKPGCAVMPRLMMLKFAHAIYGHRINIPYDRRNRIEFSVHPGPVGYLKEHQIIWQVEHSDLAYEMRETQPWWSNRVSQDMGDKAYGLLIAHLYGFLVPFTRVVGRFMPPFEFGEKTHSPRASWRRTCPAIQQPGRFTTTHGQIDPYALMNRENPDATKITAMLFQDDVQAIYSGATITDTAGQAIIEGKEGCGDTFMIGNASPVAALPLHVNDAVQNVWEKACTLFGPVRFEWCYDRTGTVWIMQFHVGQSSSYGNVIYEGATPPKRFERFIVARGLDALYELAERAERDGFGIILDGDVGITSHFGDILRRKKSLRGANCHKFVERKNSCHSWQEFFIMMQYS